MKMVLEWSCQSHRCTETAMETDGVEGKDLDELLPLIDEIMSALSVIQPRMYDAVMRKLME